MLSIEEQLQVMKEQLERTKREKEEEESRQSQARFEHALEQQIRKASAKAQQQLTASIVASPTIPNPGVVKNWKTYSNNIAISGNGAYFVPKERPDHGPVVTTIKTKHDRGFWSLVRIHQDDFVDYKLMRGRWSWFKYTFFRISPHSVVGNDRNHWYCLDDQFEKDYKLEVNLGKAFLKIDELIYNVVREEAEEVEEIRQKIRHRCFIKDLAKTDPENLKMIAGLKKLDDGLKEPLDEPEDRRKWTSAGPAITFGGPGSANTGVYKVKR